MSRTTPTTPPANAGHAGPRRIRPLSPLVASQIAAGEVVERPASAVKELVENAIDAGARRIVVELEQGGVELVRVIDDGSGIDRDDLPQALAPHATSKIEQASDLDRIATLGFRGEALASIASVSRLSIRSRTAHSPGAWELSTEGDLSAQALAAVRPAAGPVGTSVSVRNLFFNTPARRKFLKTVSTEQSRCLDTLRDLAMAHPAAGFLAKVDGRVALDVPPDQSPMDRAVALLGPELRPELLEVHADQFDDTRGVALWGLAGRPAIARATRAAQHVFVNGRAVRDRTIQHAVAESFRGLIDPTRHPTVVLMLEMSPESVDVNVHPQKAEVRFRDSGMIHSVVYHAIKRALAAADLTPTLELLRPGLADSPRAILSPGMPSPGPSGAGAASTPMDAAAASRAFVDYFKRFTPAGQTPLNDDAVRAAMQGDANAPHTPPPPAAAGHAPPADSLPTPAPAPRVLQVHNSYLVTQDEQGVLIVDQHALHERVMFEALLARVLAGELESQRLLTPVIVRSTPARCESLANLAPLLARIGIEAQPVGPEDIAVHAFPTFLFERGVDPADFLADLFERAESERFMAGARAGGEDALRDVLDMMACKAAVKAGDRLSEPELSELLRLRDAVERSSNCPHGRPTTVRLTIRELEKLFGRS